MDDFPLPLFPGQLCPEVVVSDRIKSMGQIKLFDHSTVDEQMAC